MTERSQRLDPFASAKDCVVCMSLQTGFKTYMSHLACRYSGWNLGLEAAALRRLLIMNAWDGFFCV